MKRGVFAVADVKKGERLLTIPEAAVVGPNYLTRYANGGNATDENSTDGRAADGEHTGGDIMSDWLKTTISMMLIMAEQKNGKGERRWGIGMETYFESLPLDYSTIMDWSDAEISELEGTDLHAAVKEDRANGNFEKGWRTNVSPVIDGLLKRGIINPAERELLTFELFTKASKAVVTRGFNYGDATTAAVSPNSTCGPFMIPLVDMLNHSSSPSHRSTTLKRDPASGCFYMDASRDVKSGAELLHAYISAGSNDEMLRTYGFVDDAPEICTPKRVGKGAIVGACERAYLGCLVSLALLKLSEDLSLAYPTTMKDDEELLSSPDLTQRLRCAATVRLEEKRALLILKKAALKALHYEEDEEEEKGGEGKEGDNHGGEGGNKTKRIKLF
ncbi:hypothetical protein TrRE_jg4777 [Triparma retinervis]|uniref:SET domain-containing protein n=1 Tax=Triparma retinervis TaxID=2557542 RepID=A0A9W7G4S3_9STRA|nr:hypothetical protein TrRE_jg4777 [Triparma retinervis]